MVVEFFNTKKFIRGEVVLGYGKHELTIQLPECYEITKLYLAIESVGMPVCVGALDSIGATLLNENSFNIYSDIKHNNSKVEYAALVELKNNFSSKKNQQKIENKEIITLSAGEFKNSIDDIKVVIKEWK